MRDGTLLATTVCLPLEEGEYPAVLVRTAYNRVHYVSSYFPSRGIALVVQDCRGRYESGGEFYPFVNEIDDGHDTLEWLAAQPWCNGKVGMFGDSYLAATQFYAALSGSPHLTALNPRFMAGDYWKQAYYSSGAFSLALTWSWFCFEVASQASHAQEMPMFDVAELLRKLPINKLDQYCGAGRVEYYQDYVRENEHGEFWDRIGIRDKYEKFHMPVLLVGGWYDYYPGETFANYKGLISGADDELAGSHRVIVGPWTHGMNQSSVLGEVDFGKDSLAENDCTARWLECMLKGRNVSEFQQAPIRIFVMGANIWRDEYEWPLADTCFTAFYLQAGSRLSTDAPGEGGCDSYVYDPEDPVPTLGGNHSVGPYNPGLYELAKPGPYDQRPIESRQDVLTYTTDVLAEDTEVTGPIVLKLFASSDAPDTDFVARLTDVYPDGKSINITEGILRTRFRESVHGKPKLMQPGKVYELTIELLPTANVFKAGHHIRLQVTSSNFPLWDRNLNTGENSGSATKMRKAVQTIYHGGEHPSHIILPLIRGNC